MGSATHMATMGRDVLGVLATIRRDVFGALAIMRRDVVGALPTMRRDVVGALATMRRGMAAVFRQQPFWDIAIYLYSIRFVIPHQPIRGKPADK